MPSITSITNGFWAILQQNTSQINYKHSRTKGTQQSLCFILFLAFQPWIDCDCLHTKPHTSPDPPTRFGPSRRRPLRPASGVPTPGIPGHLRLSPYLASASSASMVSAGRAAEAASAEEVGKNGGFLGRSCFLVFFCTFGRRCRKRFYPSSSKRKTGCQRVGFPTTPSVFRDGE